MACHIDVLSINQIVELIALSRDLLVKSLEVSHSNSLLLLSLLRNVVLHHTHNWSLVLALGVAATSVSVSRTEDDHST